MRPWAAHAVVLPLLPVLWVQGTVVRRSTVRLPDAAGEPHGELPGALPALRLWTLGESTVAGVGASTQEDAMPRQVAGHVARHTGRAVAWDALGISGITVEGLHARVSRLPAVPSAHACVVAVGVNDTTGMTRARRFVEGMDALVALVRRRVGAAVPVVVAGVPPMQHFPALPQPLRLAMGLRSQVLDAALRAWCARQDAVVHVPTSPRPDWDFAADGYHPGPRSYRAWSAALAEAVVRLQGP